MTEHRIIEMPATDGDEILLRSNEEPTSQGIKGRLEEILNIEVLSPPMGPKMTGHSHGHRVPPRRGPRRRAAAPAHALSDGTFPSEGSFPARPRVGDRVPDQGKNGDLEQLALLREPEGRH